MARDVRSTPFGPIPIEWRLTPVGSVGSVQVGRARSPATDTGPNMVPYLRVANVLDGYIDYSDVYAMHFSKADEQKYSLRNGDILLNEGQSTELVGRSAVFEGPEHRYCYQNSLVNFRCGPSVTPTFARAVFKRWLDIGHFTTIVKQTTSMAHLGSERFARLEFPVPPLPEQRWIAEVLDTLDEAIRKTEQLTAKLKKLKQGLLNDLLTRGIDENDELRDPVRDPKQFKDSSIGRLPDEWRVLPLSALASRVTDGTHQAVTTLADGAGTVPFLYVSCVRDGNIQWDAAARISRRTFVEITKGREPAPGMVLYTAVGSFGHAAVVNVKREFAFQRHIACIYVQQSKIDSEYLGMWLNSEHIRQHGERVAIGSAQRTVTLGELAAFPVALPSLAEQRKLVAAYAAAETRIAAESEAVAKLRDLKRGVVEDLLTGRVRVTKLLDEKAA